ncbi:AzlC family ABC transporter permease [Chloroflexota bacterium]
MPSTEVNIAAQPLTSIESFLKGFRFMLPLWIGAAPVAISYAVAAHQAGLSVLETQLMSVFVVSAAVQLNALHLWGSGAPFVMILLSTLSVISHHILFGISLVRRMPLTLVKRLTAAYFLTDGSYLVTMAEGSRATYPFLLGAGISMFVAWNLFTLLGAKAGNTVVSLIDFDLSIIIGLTFFTLLLLSISTWTDIGTAIVSGTAALVFGHLWKEGFGMLFAIGLGAAFGAYWSNRKPKQLTSG